MSPCLVCTVYIDIDFSLPVLGLFLSCPILLATKFVFPYHLWSCIRMKIDSHFNRAKMAIIYLLMYFNCEFLNSYSDSIFMQWVNFSTHWKDVERICRILLSDVGFLMSFRRAEKFSHYRGISYYRNQKF